MFKLRIVQANFGDSFIVEYGTAASPRYLLIDGGPAGVFENDLRAELKSIAGSGGKLDLMAISHVDNDHIVGLLDLLAEIRENRADGKPDLIAIGGLWHNSFSDTIDANGTLAPKMAGLQAMAMAAPESAGAVLGIGEGNRLRVMATQLAIPLNKGFPTKLICVDDAPTDKVFGNLSLRIVGPTRANLDELRQEWEHWIDENGPAIAGGDPQVLANADKSVPNLSSVMFLAKADGKTVLFTGDGRSDHLLAGLGTAGLLDGNGSLHVDVLKVAHHGSDRNVTKTFFKKVTADTYVVSANGHPDNPDLATLIWLIEAAKEQNREIEIVFTNQTQATKKLPKEYPPAEYGYKVTIMPSNKHSMSLTLAA